MANGFFMADVPGQFQLGRQIAQQNKAEELKFKQLQLGAEQQQKLAQ